MTSESPIYKYEPEDLFDGVYVQAAKAIRYNDQATLFYLLNGENIARRKIDPNHVGKQGMTLLLWAASHDNIKAVEILLKHGADPNQKIMNLQGETFQLLAIAAKGKSDPLFEMLLRYKADPNSRDRDEPALFSAIYADRFDRMDAILSAGGDINITNAAGTPAIMVLARLRYYTQLLKLLDHGAVLDEKVAKDMAYLIQKYPLTNKTPDYESQLKLKELLTNRGYRF